MLPGELGVSLAVQTQPEGSGLFIGTDVGGTKIAVGLVDSRGSILAQDRQATDVSNPAATLDGIAAAVGSFIKKNGVDRKHIHALGFGIPGLVDAARGVGIASVNLGWKNVPVRAELESRLGVPCVIDNDVRAGALGEFRFGAARGVQHLIYINIGTGMSAVILQDGRFVLGRHGAAGEIGHAVFEPGGRPCKCGGEGCLEALVSGPGIADRAAGKIKAGQESILSAQSSPTGTSLTAKMVFDAALARDAVALTTLEEVSAIMAQALQFIVLAYDPDLIVIGGSVFLESPILYRLTQQKLRDYANRSWVFSTAYTEDLIKLSELGNNAGVLGAAALVAS